MKNLLTGFAFLAMLVLATATAQAGGSAGSIGVGAEIQLSGTAGLSADYDAGPFHVGGLVGIYDPNGPDNAVDLGAHFYWHVHSTAMSDFGLGGALGMQFVKNGNAMNNSQTLVYIEPGFQIRAFIAANVALSFSGGFEIGLADASGFALGGHFAGQNGVNVGNGVVGFDAAAGFHYYFF